MGFKDWFKRNKDPTYFDQTSNINAIGVARVNDIKKLIKQIETKATKEYVDQNDAKTLNDSKVYTDQQIATIHPAPDLSVYARKDQANTFSENQTINGFLINNGLYKEGSDQQLAYIKNQGEKNIDILFEQQNAGFRNFCNLNIKHKYSNTNATTLFQIQTKNTNEGIFLACENNKFNFVSPTTITNVNTPTNDDHAANKQYVDNAIANIPPVDLSNVAKKNETNQFTAEQDMTLVRIGQGQLLSVTGENHSLVNKQYADSYLWKDNIFSGNNTFRYLPKGLAEDGKVLLPKTGGDFATKAYVDSQQSNIPPACFEYTSQVSIRYNKRDVTNSLWYYVANPTTIQLNNVPNSFRGKRVFAIIELHDINTPSGWKVLKQFCGMNWFDVPANGNITVNLEQFDFIFHWDLKPGGTGDVNITSQFHIGLVRIN